MWNDWGWEGPSFFPLQVTWGRSRTKWSTATRERILKVGKGTDQWVTGSGTLDRSNMVGPPSHPLSVSTGFKYIEDFPCRQWINSYNSTVSKRTMHGWPHCGNDERTIPSMGEFLSKAPGPLTPWPSRLVGWGWWPTGDETRMVAICFFRFWWVMMGKLSSFMVEVGFLKGSCQQMVRKC